MNRGTIVATRSPRRTVFDEPTSWFWRDSNPRSCGWESDALTIRPSQPDVGAQTQLQRPRHSCWLAITKFESPMAFVVCRNGLHFVQPLSLGLQGRSNDICSSNDHVLSDIQDIQDCRSNSDSLETEWYEQACPLGQSVDAPRPRRLKYQSNTSPPPPLHPRNTTIELWQSPSLITYCLNSSKDKAACGLALIPSIMAADPYSRAGVNYVVTVIERN